MISKKYLIFISFIIFTLTNISNSNSIEPDIFVQSTVNRASQVLSDNLTKEQMINLLADIVSEKYDQEREAIGSAEQDMSSDEFLDKNKRHIYK